MTEAEMRAHIVPINVNGLSGRMLTLPAPKGKNREILYVYGHHSSIERWIGFAEDLNQYGAVTVPDLPGFGGMDSFYKIGMKPTIDNLADYLAAFIKMRYKRKKVSVCGLSLGFVVVTRMLQRCPELNKKIDILVSVVGFSHRDDFIFSKPRYWSYRLGAGLISRKYVSKFFRNTALRPAVIRHFYAKTHNAKSKFEGLSPEQAKQATDMEISLWRDSDIRTHMYTTVMMLKVDNCQIAIPRKLWHVSVAADQYFDSKVIEQHLKIIFDSVEILHAPAAKHAPTVIATKEETQDIIPNKLRTLLSRKQV